MNSQILTPKHANPPAVGGSPRDGRHGSRPPASASTLEPVGPEPERLSRHPRSELGLNTGNGRIQDRNEQQFGATERPCRRRIIAASRQFHGSFNGAGSSTLQSRWPSLQRGINRIVDLRHPAPSASHKKETRARQAPSRLRPSPDVERLTRYEAGFLTTEERDHACDVPRLSNAAQRYL